MADPFPKTIGKYEVLSVIGRGGMGIVYKAHDPIIGRIVAIKTISVAPDLKPEELSRRLQMEAQSAGRLQHPNIATIYDFGTLGHMPYIVLEYVEGTDLARVIETGVDLTLHQKCNVLVDVAHGLAYAHELDVVHRDMKPSNVRLTNRCVAKIIDFGLARFDSTRLTRTGFMSGTIAYMSPERIHGTEGPSDDIFALAVIAYELLTYKRAFPGSTAPEVIMKIISQTPPPPSEIAALPPGLDPIVMKGLARETGDRYATAAEFAEALDAFRHSDEMRAFTHEDVRRTSPGRPMAGSLTLPGDHDEANLPTHIEFTSDEEAATEIDARLVQPGTALRNADGEVTDADGEPTEPIEDPASAPTRIERVPDGGGRRRMVIGGALVAFAVIATIAGALLLPRTPVSPPAEPAPAATGTPEPTAPAAAATVPAGESPSNSAIESDVRNQRLLLTELRNDLAALHLDDEERARFRRAEEMGDLAETKYRENSLEESTRILSETIGALRELRRDHYERVSSRAAESQTAPQTAPVTKRPPQRTTRSEPQPSRVEPSAIERPAAVEAPPPPQPAVEPEDEAPSPEALRNEITGFIGRLAQAYETRDIGFFREHDRNFSERLAEAIRNSPSVEVRMRISSIELVGPDRARVALVRTDTFANADIPPGVQTLVLELDRSSGQWEIVSQQRQASP